MFEIFNVRGKVDGCYCMRELYENRKTALTVEFSEVDWGLGGGLLPHRGIAIPMSVLRLDFRSNALQTEIYKMKLQAPSYKLINLFWPCSSD